MNDHMTTGQWFGTLLLGCIPGVNLILYLVWAFGNDQYPDRKAFARAQLIFVLISTVLSIIVGIISGGSILALMAAMTEM